VGPSAAALRASVCQVESSDLAKPLLLTLELSLLAFGKYGVIDRSPDMEWER
jgi:hypothetical protein